MSRSIEDLVRAAQHEQAERAVDPRRILAALPQRRVRAVRRRRLALTLAAAAVVAVAAVPAFVLRDGPAPQPPSVTPNPSVSAVDTRLVPLEFSPGWLPPGYAEYYRTVRPGAGLTRMWASAAPKSPLLMDDAPDRLVMTVVATADAEVTRDEGDQPVDINGISGSYRPAGQPGVYWQAGAVTIEIRTDEPGLPQATLLRIARSVRPDPAALRLPFTVRPPADRVVASQTVKGVSPGEWLAVTDFGELDPFGDIVASGTSISIGTVTPAPSGGTSLRVAGHPARYRYSELPEPGNYLIVDLGNGLQLTVYSMELDRPAIVALAESAGSPEPGAAAWTGS
ncbi:hypothetical protein [Actinoplanes sp. NPDC049599]|uniref:hypothetical protein n=1 Tax=Actinoplanes sp. NPDC049599 TaxID=3363903 RepID=UPI00379ED5A7